MHPGIGRMFWTDWDRYGPKIEVANMDGTDRQVQKIDIKHGVIASMSVDFGKHWPRGTKLSDC